MSSPTSQPLDLDALPPAAREAFLAMQAKVAGLEAHTERQDYLPLVVCRQTTAGQWIAELRHALYGKRSEQLDPDERQLAFEDLETAVAEAEAARDALTVRNADGTTRRPAAKRNLGHLPDHLPRIEQVIEPAQKVCPCDCTDMVKPPSRGLHANHCRAMGEDRSERLDILPARFQVIRCPAAHVYMRERGHRPPPLCLPPLRCRRLTSRGASLADRGWAAHRRHARPCGRVQICRSSAALPPVPDLQTWRRQS